MSCDTFDGINANEWGDSSDTSRSERMLVSVERQERLGSEARGLARANLVTTL